MTHSWTDPGGRGGGEKEEVEAGGGGGERGSGGDGRNISQTEEHMLVHVYP